MSPGKSLLACIVCSVALQNVARADDCREPKTGTREVPVFSPPLADVVNERCPMSGVFVIPKDELIAYAQTDDGWSSVMYTNPKNGTNVSGWVRPVRLKETGTVGPRQ